MVDRNLSITIDAKKFRAAVKKNPGLIERGFVFEAKNHGALFLREMDSRFTAQLSGPWKRNTTRSKLANRTGSLSRSMRSTVTHGNSRGAGEVLLTATIGNTKTGAYARIQEKGGTIRPKRAKFLAIPGPANLTAAGRVRFPNPRQIEGLFFFKKGGNAYLAREKTEGEIEIMFVLKRSVKIPPRLGFVKTWNSAKLARDRKERFQGVVDKVLRLSGLS